MDIAGYSKLLGIVPVSGARLAGWMMDMDWEVNLGLSSLTQFIVAMAFHMNLVNQFAGSIAGYIQSMIGSLLGGATLILLILAVGGYALYRGLIQWQVGRMLRAVLASVIVLGFAFGFATHMQQYVLFMSNLSDSLAGTVMSTIDEPIINQQSGGKVPNTTSNAVAYADNQIFKIDVLMPWSAMELGQITPLTGSSSSMTFSAAEASKMDAWEQSHRSPTTAGAILRDSGIGTTLYYGLKGLWGIGGLLTQSSGYPPIVANQTPIPQTILGSSPGSSFRTEVVQVLGNTNISHLNTSNSSNHPYASYMLSGQDAWSRLISVGLVDLVSLVMLVFIGALAVEMMVAQVIIIIALLFAPVALFIGVFPEMGFSIFLRWLKMLLGAFFIRVLVSATLAVLFFGLEMMLGKSRYNNFFEPEILAVLVVGGVWYLRRMLKGKGFQTGVKSQLGALGAGAGAGMLADRMMTPPAPALNPNGGRSAVMHGGAMSREGAPSAEPQQSSARRYASQIGSKLQGTAQYQKFAKAMGLDTTLNPHGDLKIDPTTGQKVKDGAKSAGSAVFKATKSAMGAGVSANPLGQSVAKLGLMRMHGQKSASSLASHQASIAKQRSHGLTPLQVGPLASARHHLAGVGLWGHGQTASAWNKAKNAQGAKKVAWGAASIGAGALTGIAGGMAMGAGALHTGHATLRRLDEAILAPVGSHLMGADLKPKRQPGQSHAYSAKGSAPTINESDDIRDDAPNSPAFNPAPKPKVEDLTAPKADPNRPPSAPDVETEDDPLRRGMSRMAGASRVKQDFQQKAQGSAPETETSNWQGSAFESGSKATPMPPSSINSEASIKHPEPTVAEAPTPMPPTSPRIRRPQDLRGQTLPKRPSRNDDNQ